MIPLPDPWRLFPHKSPSSREPALGSASLAGGLLTLGAFGVLVAVTLGGGSFAYTLSPWLSIPAGVLCFGLGMAVFDRAPLILLGIIEALFYSYVAFLGSGGFDRPDPAYSWIYSGIAAAVFLWAAFSIWRDRD